MHFLLLLQSGRRNRISKFIFRSAEALLLKGSVLLDLKRYTDATSHFREALMVAPHHYELHKYKFYILKTLKNWQASFMDCFFFHGNLEVSIICRQKGKNFVDDFFLWSPTPMV